MNIVGGDLTNRGFINQSMQAKTGCILFLEPGNDFTKELIDPIESEFVGIKESCQDWSLSKVREKCDTFLKNHVTLNEYYVTMQVNLHSRLTAASDTSLKQLGDGVHGIKFYLKPKDSNANTNTNTNNDNNNDSEENNGNNGDGSNESAENDPEKKEKKYDWKKRIARMFKCRFLLYSLFGFAIIVQFCVSNHFFTIVCCFYNVQRDRSFILLSNVS